MLKQRDSEEVIKYFQEISKIPRSSGNEKAISDYLVNFAKKRGLWFHQDDLFNVIIKKPATRGYENIPPIIIQGHTDMVCIKNPNKIHDFKKDSIKLIFDGDFIKADGTTLGADNGVAVAMALALISSTTIQHPELELLFTSSEENGMFGANALDYSLLNGKTFINIDSEEEGFFCVSCAGGKRIKMKLNIDNLEKNDNNNFYKLTIKGLKGGHSGIEIDKERANSNVLMARVLSKLVYEHKLIFGELKGGLKENAIPNITSCILSIDKDNIDEIKEEINNFENIFKNEYKITDSNLDISLEVYNEDAEMFSVESSMKLISTILLIPNGISNMSMEITGLVETSLNLGVIRTKGNTVSFECSLRSAVNTRKNLLTEKMYTIANFVGAEIEESGDYPAWEYKKESKIREVFLKTYKDIYGKEAEVVAIHAGLECGLFSQNLKDVDMISLGSDIFDAHTPNERMSISSLNRVWNMLLTVLENCKDF